VAHEFLNPKIMDAQIKMQSGRHAYRTHVRRAVASSPHLVQFGQTGNLSQVRNSSRMHNRGPDVIDELLLDQLLAIENGIENFADGERRGGVLTDETKTFLQLRRNRIFKPKQVIRLEALSEAPRFYWR
jgi:hypothetical protein